MELLENLLISTMKKSSSRQFSFVQLFGKNTLDNFNPFCPNTGRREKTKFNFYFHISLWCLKRFYEDLFPAFGLNIEGYSVSLRIQFEWRKNAFVKLFEAPQREFENEN